MKTTPPALNELPPLRLHFAQGHYITTTLPSDNDQDSRSNKKFYKYYSSHGRGGPSYKKGGVDNSGDGVGVGVGVNALNNKAMGASEHQEQYRSADLSASASRSGSSSDLERRAGHGLGAGAIAGIVLGATGSAVLVVLVAAVAIRKWGGARSRSRRDPKVKDRDARYDMMPLEEVEDLDASHDQEPEYDQQHDPQPDIHHHVQPNNNY
jgi:hypothetical protein